MNSALQFMAFFISWLSLGLTIATIAMPDWRVNDVEGEVVELIKRTQGLWTKCAFFPTGNWQCEDYDRFFIALPAAITGARVFSILALLFQLGGIIAQPFGMECTTVIDPHQKPGLKARIVICCGALSILAAVCIGIAVSWYAALVVEDYSRYTTGLSAGIETAVQRFIYGKALYLGWATMSLSFIQGVMLCCSSWGEHEGGGAYHEGHNMDYNNAPYSSYNAPKAQMMNNHNNGTEYI